MQTSFRGTFVISWSQTEVDGLGAAPLESLDVGATWAWHGEVVRVDGPSDVLRLEQADGENNIRRRAAHMVRKLIGAAVTHTTRLDEVDVSDPVRDSSFVVTDGAQSFTVTVIETGTGAPPLLMFLDDIPPKDRDLWVVHHTLESVAAHATSPANGGVICFTPGTRIETPNGPRLVE